MKWRVIIVVFAAVGCGPSSPYDSVTDSAASLGHTPSVRGAPVDQPVALAHDEADRPDRHPTHADPRLNAPFVGSEVDVDTWTNRFEGESREVYRARQSIADALQLRPGDAVADIGTGTGLFVRYLSERVGPQGKVVAVDISPAFVEHVQARARAAALTNVEVQLGTSDDPGLEPSGFDVLFVCDTYHHFEEPAEMLNKLRQALKPGGRLLVVDMHRIEGKTSAFWLDHLRAGQEVFAAEISAAGFERLPDPPASFLQDNYLMAFRR